MATTQAFREYITQNHQAFYRLAYSYTKNSDAALDVVQDAIVKGIEKLHTLRNPAYMKTWFYRILVNEGLNYLRGKKVVSLDEYAESPLSAAEDRDVAQVDTPKHLIHGKIIPRDIIHSASVSHYIIIVPDIFFPVPLFRQPAELRVYDRLPPALHIYIGNKPHRPHKYDHTHGNENRIYHPDHRLCTI